MISRRQKTRSRDSYLIVFLSLYLSFFGSTRVVLFSVFHYRYGVYFQRVVVVASLRHQRRRIVTWVLLTSRPSSDIPPHRKVFVVVSILLAKANQLGFFFSEEEKENHAEWQKCRRGPIQLRRNFRSYALHTREDSIRATQSIKLSKRQPEMKKKE